MTTSDVEEYTIEKKQITKYKVRAKNRGLWGDACVEEWEGGGSIDINSDWGNYAYRWGSIGNQCLREFLLGLDMDYAMKKLSGYKMTQFDLKQTVIDIRKEIVRCRRDREVDEMDARSAWDELERMERPDSQELFCEYLMRDCPTLMDKVFCHCYETIPISHRLKPCIKGFWNEIWPMFCDVWRKELNAA